MSGGVQASVVGTRKGLRQLTSPFSAPRPRLAPPGSSSDHGSWLLAAPRGWDGV